ncbi:MAG: hypothetical protein ACRDPB_05695 [Nocardioidaceae bacterium]
MTPEQRSESARDAARARWNKHVPVYATPGMVAVMEKTLESVDAEIAQLRADRAVLKRILDEQKSAARS